MAENAQSLSRDIILVYRIWSENTKVPIIFEFDGTIIEKLVAKYTSSENKLFVYTFGWGMACAVLKVAGLIDTDHPKLIEHQSQHRDLGRILRKPNVERTVLDKMGLKTNINAAAKDIVDFAANIKLNGQLRMAPGQFDMTNTLCYADSVVDGPNIDLQDEQFRMAREIEGFMLNSCATLQASPANRVLPYLLALKSSHCFVSPCGTSKANTGTMWVTLNHIGDMKKTFGYMNEDFGVPVPYAEQRKRYAKEINAEGSEFKGGRVGTVQSLLGWEFSIVIYDLASAANLGGQVGFISDPRKICVGTSRKSKLLS